MKQYYRYCWLIFLMAGSLAMTAGATGRGLVTGSRNASLTMMPPDTAHGLIGRYYTGQTFDTYVDTRIDSVLALDWGSGSPMAGIGVDNFSVRWTGYIKVPKTGTYTFYTKSDDGARVMIDGLIIIDYWTTCCSEHTGTKYMEAGKLYPFAYDFREGGGGAAVNYLDWSGPDLDRELVPNSAFYAIEPPTSLPEPDITKDTTHGLVGYYYTQPSSNPKYFDTLTATRIDPMINFDWGSNSPMPGRMPVDNFSVKWIGFINAPVTGTYTFHTWTDDGARLYINGQKIIDYWGTCCADESGTIDLDGGRLYPIILEMHEGGGGAGAHYINWEADGLPLQNIPNSAYYTVFLQTVNKPTISPTSAIYVDSLRVTLNTLTSGSEIHYTLDGSTPDENSPLYSEPVLVTQDSKLTAVAFHEGMVKSVPASETYRIIPPLVSDPTFTPSQGIYSKPVEVKIETKEDSTTIYYTLDGSNPDTNSTVYSEPVSIDSTMRLKAYAVREGLTPSKVSSSTYTILPPGTAEPVFSVPGGSYNSEQTVTITSSTPGAVIHYALNLDVLNDASPVYSAPIKITKTTTLKAYAEKDGLRSSDVTIADYVLGNNVDKVETPKFSIPTGTYNTAQQVVITTETRGSTIYYTLDGSQPNETSPVFFAPIAIQDSMTIKTFATKPGMAASDIASGKFIVTSLQGDTGIINDKLPTPQLVISPNPAINQARITWNKMVYTDDGAYLTITDSKGVVMKQINIKGGYTYYVLNTTTYANGVYYVRVISASSVVYGKLIIAR